MLFTCDVGNTHLVFGCFSGTELVASIRLKTDQLRTADELRVLLLSLLQHKLGGDFSFSSAIVSSVVPQATKSLVTLIKDEFEIDPHVVGPGTKTGLSVRVKNPSAVGSDRIVNAVAVKTLFGMPALVIDFGTAISFDFVDNDSSYCGGIIAPGIEIALDALVKNTAKLSRVELKMPQNVIGNDTNTAMQSGLVLGYQCLVSGLIKAVTEEQGEVKHVIATGGNGVLIADGIDTISEYVPDLTQQGLRILAEMNL